MEIEAIKKKLKSEKISYDLLSQKSGVPLNTLKNIFSKRTPHPRIDTIQAIERALGLTDGENANKGVFLTDDETRLLTAFRGLIPEMQEYILKIVENLTGEKAKENIV
ncbi:MAG: helix-turn-helix transcriptional regulator [Clostridia bacterium]|nr:helix-turn-helix transcriptional regulator [Clostridia bacterium]MBP5466071.1 helix-turn-helix transcriptional regulator [Clostridia bacterium]